MDYRKIGKVLVSKHKSKVLFCLTGGLKTPSQIAKDVDMQLAHVSKTLSDLDDLGLVKCENPELKKGRIYTLTQQGKAIIELLEKTKGRSEK